MRQAGSLPSENQAQRFADYLATLGIAARVDRAADGWTVWIRDEDRLDQARGELESFRSHPEDPRYQGAPEQARRLRKERARKDAAARRNWIDMRGYWDRAQVGSIPLTWLLVAISVLVAALAALPGRDEVVYNALRIEPVLEADGSHYYRLGLSAVRSGQVWRLVTPIFLHFHVLGIPFIHLLFNMLWLHLFGGQIEARQGSWVLAGLVLLSAVASNLAQYGVSGPTFGGMSGVNYALFGYLWMKTRYDAASRLYLPPNIVSLLLVWFVICWLGWVGHVANTAHTVGLGVGMLAGYGPVFVRRQWRRWRR